MAMALVAVTVLSSCLSTGPQKTPDEKAIDRGVEAWNKRSPAAAKPYWSTIKDEDTKAKYLGYIDDVDAATAAVDSAADLGASQESKAYSLYIKAQKACAALPDNLPAPKALQGKALDLAEGRMRAIIKADRLQDAKEFGQGAVKVFGDSDAIAKMQTEIGQVLASRKKETAIEESLDKARALDNFNDKVAAYDAVAEDYAKARSGFASDSKGAGVGDAPAVVVQLSHLKQKRQDVLIEKEKAIRDKAYALQDRIGAEFARPPEGNKNLGSMTLQEILDYQESVRKNVNNAYKDLLDFTQVYPDAVDSDFLDQVEIQKKDLDDKIAQVEAEIRTAKEIASRGKVVLPVIIGLFNAQPGNKDEAKKSRPAVFNATGTKKAEYWWGMVSIPKGTMNDLVVTVKDSRTVRVFGSNTKSGKLIGKDGNVDLVNKGFKVGNSWPVLNAGKVLPTDKYFFEIGAGKTDSYEGEVVVYSSFITRMR
jgi:hypothetical protein